MVLVEFVFIKYFEVTFSSLSVTNLLLLQTYLNAILQTHCYCFFLKYNQVLPEINVSKTIIQTLFSESLIRVVVT